MNQSIEGVHRNARHTSSLEKQKKTKELEAFASPKVRMSQQFDRLFTSDRTFDFANGATTTVGLLLCEVAGQSGKEEEEEEEEKRDGWTDLMIVAGKSRQWSCERGQTK